MDLDYNADKNLLVSGSCDKSVAFIKLTEKRIIKKYENLEDMVYGVKFI